MMRRAVVTGPTGAVGCALIDELLAHDVRVVAVCRPCSPRRANLPQDDRVEIVECSLDDMASLPERVAGTADAFFHLAWDGTYGTARQDWGLQASNVAHACEAVHAAHRLGCSVFVGAGSQSEFGHVEGVMSPDAPCDPDNGYGAAKLAACVMSRAMCAHLGMRQEWCRILSLFGPGDGDHPLTSQVIDGLLRGEHVACTAGDQVWDYIYSKDAARAFRLVAERGRHGSVYCLGSGRPRRLREYIEAIAEAIGGSGTVGFGERAYYPNQVMHLEADISNLVADTGFRPKYSFEQGIRETIESRKGRLL